MLPILLQYYLAQHGDSSNVLRLYEQKLVIIFRGTSTTISIADITVLDIVRKKLIIPFVIGGIGTCLAGLSLSMGWYHYEFNLFCVFVFFAWMYYGHIGTDALEVTESRHRHIFLIRSSHIGLNAFLQFAKKRVGWIQQNAEHIAYHLVYHFDWECQLQSEFYRHASLKTHGFIHATYANELQDVYKRYFLPTDRLVLIAIALSHVSVDIQEAYDEARQVRFPHLYGMLNKSAILHLHEITQLADLEMFLTYSGSR